MNQIVMAFVGISGVGKTTFLRRLAQLVHFQHLSAGSIISIARDIEPELRDTIRHSEIEGNQRFLVEGFSRARDQESNIVVLDGHVVIDDGQCLSRIPSAVFGAMGISTIVHLDAEPERISRNRRSDASRLRPLHPTENLKLHQEISRCHARSIAQDLHIPHHFVTHDDVENLALFLERL